MKRLDLLKQLIAIEFSEMDERDATHHFGLLMQEVISSNPLIVAEAGMDATKVDAFIDNFIY